MKSTVPRLGFILSLVVAAAMAQDSSSPKVTEDNPAAQPVKPSTSRLIMAGLPKYSPPPPAADAKSGPEPIAADPDMIELPKMVVRQKPRPRLNAEAMYGKDGFAALFAVQNYSQLDRALNKYTLPLFGRSIEARAWDDYQREKNRQMVEDVKGLSEVVNVTDPEAAKELRAAAAPR